MLSDFARGYDELDRVRSELAPHAWSRQIKGEYSGLILRMTDDELRRLGRPRIDSVELIWDHDAIAIDVYLFPDTDHSYSVISASTSLASNTSDSCQPR